MNVKIIIQARLGSSRLPKKVLMKIGNTSMLEIIVQSLISRFDKDSIIIATTKNKLDDKIHKFCEDSGVLCFRGEEENVASRFKIIIDSDDSITHFFRVCADGPLVNLSGMEEALKIIKES